MILPGNFLPLIIAGLVLVALALPGCADPLRFAVSDITPTALKPDKDWQTSRSRSFWEDHERRGGGSSE